MSTPSSKARSLGDLRLLSFAWLVSGLAILPVLFVVLSLFQPDNGAWQHLTETILPSYIGNTLLLMGLVFVFATSIGVSTAWLVATTRFPGDRLFSWALVLPLAAPAYIVAYVYTDLLEYAGPVQSFLRDMTGWGRTDYWFPQIRTLPGAALMISLVLYPYIYLFARAAFLQRSHTLFEVARTLGLTPLAAFWRVALPAARPAIAGGAALVLMETVADYGVVDYFGVPTFSTGIFRTWFALGEQTAALKLAALMFIVVATLVVIERASRRGEVSTSLARDAGTQPFRLRGFHAILAMLACALPVVLGAIIPICVLLSYTLKGGDGQLGAAYWGFVRNSVTVALIAAGLATLLALGLNYTLRLNNTVLNRYAIQISTLGYALPGTLIAVGLLAPLTGFDRQLASFLSSTFNISTGLILTGSIGALIYAYIIRFLTVSYNACHGGFESVPRTYDHAARTLGASPARLFSDIHFPLMRNSILAGIILVFVDVMRELPATLILRPFNFETLATRVYRLASDERLAEASTAALTIVLIGLIPVISLSLLTKNRTN